MSLKLPSIFIICLIVFVPLTSFAQVMTDDQVMAKYSSPNDLQNAINNCQLDYNNLPNDAIKNSVNPNPSNCQTQSSTSQFSSIQTASNNLQSMTNLIIPLLILIMSIIIVPKIIHYLHDHRYHDYYSESGEEPKKIKINIIHKVLLLTGILKVKKK